VLPFLQWVPCSRDNFGGGSHALPHLVCCPQISFGRMDSHDRAGSGPSHELQSSHHGLAISRRTISLIGSSSTFYFCPCAIYLSCSASWPAMDSASVYQVRHSARSPLQLQIHNNGVPSPLFNGEDHLMYDSTPPSIHRN